jgi:hypothetical protein
MMMMMVALTPLLSNAIHMKHRSDPFVACLTCGAEIPEARTNDPIGCGPQSEEIADMWEKVKKLTPASDKFTDHTYQTMYGLFLMPWRTSTKGPKLFEIGLGCDMDYGPGASVKVWQTILPLVELWEAEYDAACVNKSRETGTLSDDVYTVTGDQGNATVVDRWVHESGGNYDIVIDDGGHSNSQIKTSFDGLWPHVKSGGLYFIEDLQVGRHPLWDDTNGKAVMADILEDWVEQLVTKGHPARKFPVPKDVDFVFCQHEACVIGKRKEVFPGAEWN